MPGVGVRSSYGAAVIPCNASMFLSPAYSIYVDLKSNREGAAYHQQQPDKFFAS